MNERVLDLDRSLVGAFLSRAGAACLRMLAILWRILRRRPMDSLGMIVAAGATGAILVNALFLQVSAHPAPMLAGKPRPVASAAVADSVAALSPRARPSERDAAPADAAALVRTRTQIIADIQRELARRGFFDGPIDGVYGARTDAAIRDFEHAAGMKSSSQPDEALLRAIARSATQPPSTTAATTKRGTAPGPGTAVAKPASPSKRILAVQRALADFGYGQVKPTGILGAETRTAIERFERERKLPVTGQISERLTRELAAVTGRPLE